MTEEELDDLICIQKNYILAEASDWGFGSKNTNSYD